MANLNEYIIPTFAWRYLGKPRINLIEDPDSKRVTPEYKSGALPLNQPPWFMDFSEGIDTTAAFVSTDWIKARKASVLNTALNRYTNPLDLLAPDI